MSKKNEIVIKETNAPALFEMDAELMGSLSRAESSDFDIPRLTLIQPTSKLDGNPGDVVSSNDKTTLCKAKGEPLKFVPVAFVKDFAITEVDTKKWRRNEVKNAANATLSLFENRQGQDHDGVLVERKERVNLFVVLEQDLGETFARLYRLVLKPSSFKEAKKLMREWDLQIRQGLPPFSFVWALSTEVITNDKGKFAVYQFAKDMAQGKQRQVTAEGYQAVKFWVKTLAQNKEQVVAQEVREDDESHATATEFEAGKLNF